MSQESTTLKDGITSYSVILFTPFGGRFSFRRLSSLLKELDAAGTETASIEVILAGAFDFDGLDQRTADSLTELFAENPRLKRGPMDSAAKGGALLNTALQQAQGEHIVYIDCRAYLKPGALQKILHKINTNPAAAMFVPQPEDSGLLARVTDQNQSFDLLALLLRKPTPFAVVTWNAELHERLGMFEASLNFTMLNDFLIRIACQHPLFAFDPSLANLSSLQLFPDKNTRHILEQKALDEENRVFDAALERMIAGELPGFSRAVQSQEMNRHAKVAMEQLRSLQNNNDYSPQELVHSTFAYALLTLRFGQFDNARETLGTIITLASEQLDITRLYKWLLLNDRSASNAVAAATRITAEAEAPVVSVYTPLYNQGHYLTETVASVRAQSYPHWEMLIINDGSSDDSFEVAQRLLATINDPRIRLVSHENRGKGATRNRGVAETSGTYLVCLDSDDLLAPNYFAIGVELLAKHDRVGWVTPKTVVFGGSNHIAWSKEYDFIHALHTCPAPNGSMIRREALQAVGNYREDLTNREDAESWLAMAEQGWISKTTAEPLFFYRHALRRPGMNNISNIPSKEEICSLHPWWYRMDLPKKMRHMAYIESKTFRLPKWFLNMDNIKRIAGVLHDRELFLEELAAIKSNYPIPEKPSRWDATPEGDYRKIRDELYGVRRSAEQHTAFAQKNG